MLFPKCMQTVDITAVYLGAAIRRENSRYFSILYRHHNLAKLNSESKTQGGNGGSWTYKVSIKIRRRSYIFWRHFSNPNKTLVLHFWRHEICRDLGERQDPDKPYVWMDHSLYFWGFHPKSSPPMDVHPKSWMGYSSSAWPLFRILKTLVSPTYSHNKVWYIVYFGYELQLLVV